MKPTRLTGFSARTALALALLLSPVASFAAEPSSAPTPAPTPGQVLAARELFAAAAKDEEASLWTAALEKLRRVADVKLTAGVRYHIAFCEEKLGQTATALAHFTEARDAAEREHNKDVLGLLADPFLPNLRARVPTLAIEVPPEAAGAVVTIDDHRHPSGLWGVAVPVDPGTHRIEAKAPGREPFSRELTLREREVTVLDVVLRPSTPPSPSASAPPSPASPTPASTPTPTSPSPRSLLPPVLTTAGALALLGGGLAAYFLAASAQTSGQSQCATRTTSCDDLKTPVRTWDAIALGAWIGGAALAATAIVLWATPPRRPNEAPSPSARLSLAPAQLRLEGSF